MKKVAVVRIVTFLNKKKAELLPKWENVCFFLRTNRGWRLDYFVTSRPILELVKKIEIRKENKQSDHVPLILTLEEPKANIATN